MWFCQGQGYRFHDCRGLFAVLYSTDSGSCLKWSRCMKNDRGGPRAGGRGFTRTQVVVPRLGTGCDPLPLTFGSMTLLSKHRHILWNDPLCAGVAWPPLHRLTYECVSVWHEDLSYRVRQFRGCNPGHPLGSQLQGGECEHPVRRVTGSK